jgi:NAD(P)H-flavin reductase
VTLIHAASFADELVFADRAAAWQGAGLDVEYRPTVSRPFDARNGGWRGLTGRAEGVLAAHVRDARFEARTTFGYVCGNPAMVDSCSAILRGAGLTPDSVRVERF